MFQKSNTLSTVFRGVAILDSFDYSNAMTIRELMEAVGGIRAAARLMGVAPSTAHYYCKHNRVPIKKLMLLAAMAERFSGGNLKYKEILREFG
ncbi:MAG: hypothetical protein EBR82_64515 [Caulobacteraceae bacterium]|nr:hypothetical protein [Caulobacteraceae bacterium]